MSRSCARVSTHTFCVKARCQITHDTTVQDLCEYERVCVSFLRCVSLVQHKHSQTRAHKAFGVFISPSSFGLLSPPLPTDLTLHVHTHKCAHQQTRVCLSCDEDQRVVLCPDFSQWIVEYVTDRHVCSNKLNVLMRSNETS